ncbi:MAG: ORF6N domain-containing protein [Bacteriovoracaceae bacterium]|nr:ORF6N domain-containing protein [Bacteriovoracaceae bacterium]
MDELKLSQIIYLIRGQRVMLDSDLAQLYGVETRVFNQAVKRNFSRFPEDFMFQLSFQEFTNLMSQFVTSSLHGGIRKRPYVFTENGIAMLSSVLNSEQAIQMNISIIRIFTKLRSYLVLNNETEKRLTKLEENTEKTFKIIFERLDSVDEIIYPNVPKERKKIGIKKN